MPLEPAYCHSERLAQNSRARIVERTGIVVDAHTASEVQTELRRRGPISPFDGADE
jgi:hypothetical protein